MPKLDPRFAPMHYIDELYQSHQPELAFTAETVEEWKKWRRRLKSRVLECLGGMDDSRCDLQPQVVERKQMDGYVREKVVYSARPETLVPAYILIPDGAVQARALQKRLPAVVCASGHGHGKDDLVGIDENGQQRTAGSSYQNDFAIQMVKRGFVAIAPEHMGFGERRDPREIKLGGGHGSCQQHSMAAMLFGRTNSGIRVYDVM
ncbi:MAG: alpha/beta hydrolase family protein, partial [Armatimonadota bacterium]